LPQASVAMRSPTIFEPVELASVGRHDPCVVPRAVPIVEAMTALTLLDLLLSQKAKMRPEDPCHINYINSFSP